MDEDNSTAHPAPEAEVVDSPAEVTDTGATDVQDVPEPSDSQTDADGEEPGAPEIDDKLRKFADNQGIPLDSPGAIKAAELLRKNQADKTKAFQKASELEKAATTVSDEDATARAEATGQDPELLRRVQRVEVKEAVRDFWNQEGIDRSYEPQMVSLLAEKPYLAGDLEALYATAVSRSGHVAQVKSQAKKETLSELAHKQQAAVPTGNATQRGTPKEKPFESLSIAEMEKKLGYHRL